ncbi:MAG: helix-turn-helix domain-containing protein [Saccharofermentans sp.]|nr:helix-turn-helix domain-containing protein [Saccharofermentans sp.]
MTFGEKLRNARKESGLSQEQFAVKMNVSRSAVAKWETDKGMPDITNLKVMAKLLNVSVDYLVSDEDEISFNEIKEAINLNDYEKTGKARCKNDAVCLSKNQGATAIYALLRSKKLNKIESVIDFIAGAGVVNVLDAANDMSYYYLVEKNKKQYFVNVDKEFITTKELVNKVNPSKFVIGNNEYRGSYRLI